MQISPNSPLYQLLSSAAATAAPRPDAAVRQDAAQAATQAPARNPRQMQSVMASSDSAKPRVLPRGSLVNIVT